MTAEIRYFNGITTLDIPVDRVLEAAIGQGMRKVLIIGEEDEGKLYVACSTSEVGEVLLLMERAKRRLLKLLEDE